MGYNTRVAELRALRKSLSADVSGRHVRASWTLPAFATFVTCAFVAGTLGAPGDGAFAAPVVFSDGELATQSLKVDGEYINAAGRDAFTITAPPPPEPEPVAAATSSGAPAAGTPDPGTAQAIAYDMVMARGWGQGEFDCLVSLWNKESNWNVYAHNSSSGAYGIPQALPGDKMASAGADWATNPATQITWGLGYITGRYGTPCGAWSTSEAQGWY